MCDVPYLQAVLDVLVPLVRGCKVGGLPETFVSEVFPCVVQRVLDSDDSSLLQVRRRGREREGGEGWREEGRIVVVGGRGVEVMVVVFSPSAEWRRVC